jgi:thiosulfate/3-mercaptopyruvate sulfurtransferase
MLALLPVLASVLLGTDTLLVSPAWLSAHLGQPDVVVVDVDRTRADYDAGHIEGARFLPLSALLVERDGVPNEVPPIGVLDSALQSVGIGDDSRVIITGDPLAAARLFFTLDYLGHGAQAALLDGGTPAWVAGGFPVTTDLPTVTPGDFTVVLEPGRLVDYAWMRAHLGDPGIVMLDARPASDYAGTPGSKPPTGHIPGAHNIYWKTTLAGTPPMLRPMSELEPMFEGAGARPGSAVVTYCRTGMQASFLYFVARYLGYDVKMYDGSFSEWIQQPDAPVSTGAAP